MNSLRRRTLPNRFSDVFGPIILQRDLKLKSRPICRPAVQGEIPTDFLYAMLHVGKTVPQSVVLAYREADAIVFNANLQLRIIQRNADVNFGRAGVFGNVIESLFNGEE